MNLSLDRLGGTAWEPKGQWLSALRRAGRLGSFLAFHHGGRGARGLEAALRSGYQQGVLASVREGYLRVAFHGFHVEADVERAAAWLNETAS